jgi:hypothetical protein
MPGPLSESKPRHARRESGWAWRSRGDARRLHDVPLVLLGPITREARPSRRRSGTRRTPAGRSTARSARASRPFPRRPLQRLHHRLGCFTPISVQSVPMNADRFLPPGTSASTANDRDPRVHRAIDARGERRGIPHPTIIIPAGRRAAVLLDRGRRDPGISTVSGPAMRDTGRRGSRPALFQRRMVAASWNSPRWRPDSQDVLLVAPATSTPSRDIPARRAPFGTGRRWTGRPPAAIPAPSTRTSRRGRFHDPLALF